MARQRSSWGLLELGIHAEGFACDMDVRMMSPAARGSLVMLMAYAFHRENGLPNNMAMIARMACVSKRKMPALWVEIEPFFTLYQDTWRMRYTRWLSVRTISGERIPLRHLLDKLIDFWGPLCVYCGMASADLEIEHIVPFSRGGTNELKNLTLACRECNARKRTLTAAEFGHPHIHEIAARLQ